MVKGCGNNCIKVVLLVFNALICICGAVLLGLGLWTSLNKNFQAQFQDLINKSRIDFSLNAYMAAIWVVVGIGFLLFFIGFLGCCGTACESRCMLIVFVVILVILFILELIVAITAFALKSRFKDALHQALADAASKGSNNLASIQDAFGCCGVDGMPLPDTTCPPLTAGYGCSDAIWTDLQLGITVVSGVALAVLLVELIVIVFSSILLRAISKSYSYS